MEWLNNLWVDETHRKIISSVVIFFLTTVVSFVFGRAWGRYKARREWNSKHFLGRVIVSLNTFASGKFTPENKFHPLPLLKIRTIFERGIEDVFINPVAIEKITAAAKKTTPGKPMLPIDKADRWFLLNFILNAVAEEFNEGLISFDAGKQVRPIKYLVCLTCEAVGEDRIRKVRAMMIQKDTLLNGLPAEARFEQPWHSTRLETLKHCRQVYLEEPDNFLELEVYV